MGEGVAVRKGDRGKVCACACVRACQDRVGMREREVPRKCCEGSS